jgi:hypothetical protein
MLENEKTPRSLIKQASKIPVKSSGSIRSSSIQPSPQETIKGFVRLDENTVHQNQFYTVPAIGGNSSPPRFNDSNRKINPAASTHAAQPSSPSPKNVLPNNKIVDPTPPILNDDESFFEIYLVVLNLILSVGVCLSILSVTYLALVKSYQVQPFNFTEFHNLIRSKRFMNDVRGVFGTSSEIFMSIVEKLSKKFDIIVLSLKSIHMNPKEFLENIQSQCLSIMSWVKNHERIKAFFR